MNQVATLILCAQLTHVRAHRTAERCEVITTLETRNYSSLTTAVSPLLHRSCHSDEVVVLKQQLTQRILKMRIESR